MVQTVKPFDLFYVPFPADAEGVYGVVQYDVAADRYKIAIDSNQPESVQKATLMHELQHIRLKHLEVLDGTIEEVEAAADEPMTDEELQQWLSAAVIREVSA